jgi:hypothetical protein
MATQKSSDADCNSVVFLKYVLHIFNIVFLVSMRQGGGCRVFILRFLNTNSDFVSCFVRFVERCTC